MQPVPVDPLLDSRAYLSIGKVDKEHPCLVGFSILLPQRKGDESLSSLPSNQ